MKTVKIFGYKPAEVRKFLVGVLSFALTLLAALLQGNLIPQSWTPWIIAFVAVTGSYGIYKVPNKAPVSTTS